ncbi:MAG: cobalamin B12-binding domain-containing protein [Deltaproteobacteria bacterium]|nr:cobalamin B12-binding domain-containing protein [Deltaproteobacteria bacterium]
MAKFFILQPMLYIDGKARVFLRDWTGADFPASMAIPPLDQMTAAALLRERGHEVRILDTNVTHEPPQKVIDEVAREAPDFVGLASGWEALDGDLALLGEIKKRRPEVTTVIGGPPVTVHPELALADSAVDYAAIGEIDDPFARLADGDRSANLAWREGDEIRTTPRELVKDLNALPFPARDLVPSRRYRAPFLKRNPFTTMAMSRGCSRPLCTFCTTNIYHMHRIRLRSAENVLAELEEIVHRHRIPQILFRDDTFTASEKLVRGVCEGILSRGLDVTWRCTTRHDLVNPDLLSLMARAGCHHISFGLETPNDDLLEINGKGATIEGQAEAVRWSKEAGLEVTGLFMIGVEGDTPESASRVLPFATGMQLDYAEFNIATATPGTEFYRRVAPKIAVAEKYKNRWVYNTSIMPLRQLKQMRRRAYMGFYLRPSYVLRRLINIREVGDFGLLAKTAARLLLS